MDNAEKIAREMADAEREARLKESLEIYETILDTECGAEIIYNALQRAEQRGFDTGVKNKCQLIAECKRQWIERCAEIAEKLTGGGASSIAKAIRREAENDGCREGGD